MRLSQDGRGEALIFPFYSALDDDRTLITITNSTGYVKGVTVKVREGLNGAQALGWHVYLAPYDSFSFTISPDPYGVGAVTGPVASEATCTVPSFRGWEDGVPLRNYYWASDGFSGVERSVSGHVEVIEMGQWDPFVGVKGPAASQGASGSFAGCDILVDAWSIIQGVDGDWISNSSDEALPWRGGGLSGSATIRSASATFSYDALSIEEFTRYELPAEYHEQPGSSGILWPAASLNSASRSYEQDISGQSVRQTALEGRDAVSALLSSAIVQSTAPALNNSVQSWIVSYPTKHLHTRYDSWLGAFSETWDNVRSQSCDYVEVGYYEPTDATFEKLDNLELCATVNAVNTSTAGDTPFNLPYWSTTSINSQPEGPPNSLRFGYRSASSQASDLTYDRTVTVNTNYDSDTRIAGLPMVVLPIYFTALSDTQVGSVRSVNTRIYSRIVTSVTSVEYSSDEAFVSLDTSNTSGFAVTGHVIYCQGSEGFLQGRSESESILLAPLRRGETYNCVAFASADSGRGEATEAFTLQAADNPGAPIIVRVEPEDGAIRLSVRAENNGSEIIFYKAACTDGTNTYTDTSTTSPITVSGLTNDVAYTCTVTATNSVGTSVASAATATITPEETTTSLPVWLLYQATQ